MSEGPTSESLPPESPPSPERSWRLPRLSGKATAACLVGFFLTTGLLIPGVLRLPLWIDFEIVLAVWWLTWGIVLSVILYRGQRVDDDHQLAEPRNWLNVFKGNSKETQTTDPLDIRKPTRRSSSGWWDGLWWIGPVDGEGCLALIAMVLLMIVALFALWFLIEIAIPVVLFILYCIARGMLAAVVNDRHHCRGRLGHALFWGLTFATLYTAPLAGVVWFVHYVMTRPPVA